MLPTSLPIPSLPSCGPCREPACPPVFLPSPHLCSRNVGTARLHAGSSSTSGSGRNRQDRVPGSPSENSAQLLQPDFPQSPHSLPHPPHKAPVVTLLGPPLAREEIEGKADRPGRTDRTEELSVQPGRKRSSLSFAVLRGMSSVAW
jgi:hypothetical protein